MLRTFLTSATFSNDIAALILRLTFGGLLLFSHGYMKWTLFSESMDSFPDPLGIGSKSSFYAIIFAETVCAALVMLGLFTRIALLPMLFAMVVAILGIHWESPVSEQELAILYFAVYLAIFLLGPGKYSLDAFVSKKQ
jgi:putative oxidoreductase